MLIITFVIIVIYLVAIGSLIYGFDKVEERRLTDSIPVISFSILIPFRNESSHLHGLLNSIKNLNYPKNLFELIFIDDDSTDSSVEIITDHLQNSDITFQIHALSGHNESPKKAAISEGIRIAKFDWILTTDADCIVPKYWLDCYDDLIQKTDAKCIAGPVTYTEVNSFFKRFQLLDFLSLQGATIGGFGLGRPFLGNGANFAYTTKLFHELDGFTGNTKIASGDDVFIIQKAAKENKGILYYLKNKEAIVKTSAQINFKNLLSQRVRWAAKATKYHSVFGKLIGIIVLLMNGLFVSAPFLVIGGIMTLHTLAYTIFIKLCLDFLLLFKTSRFFDQESILSTYFFAGICYPFFSTYVAILSIFKGYSWKGRSYSK